MTAVAMFVVFIGLLLVGVPVSMTIAMGVVVGIVVGGWSSDFYILPQQLLEGIDNPSLLAIPFFILAGNLLNVSGLTERIYGLAVALVGHFRAGLAQVNVLGSMIFSGISGSAVADMASLGTIEIKAMRDHGYKPEFAAALTIASSVVGPLIPPSVGLIVFAYLSNTSVARLFLAGTIPGVLVGVGLMIYVRIVAIWRQFPSQERQSLRQVGGSIRDGWLALLAPVIILGTMVTGWATATEAGVVACAYALLLALIYRSLTLNGLWKALTDTMSVTAILMVIIGFSTVMSWLLAMDRVPQQLADAVLSTTQDRNLFLFLLMMFFLVIGCFIEGVPAKLLLVPALLPLTDAFGLDRVQFGVMVQLALLIGIATPPMGIGLFIVSEIAKLPVHRVTVAVLPMIIPLFIVLMLITYIPELTLWLPDLLMGTR